MKADAIHEIVATESDQERFWRRVPIIGWMIGNKSWNEQARPIVADIHRQLLIRPTCPQVWGDDPRRLDFALWLCKKIAEEIVWPSDCFIPDDPIDVVLWEHAFDGDTAHLEMDIEDRLRIELEHKDVSSWFGHALGEVVDLLLAGRTSFA